MERARVMTPWPLLQHPCVWRLSNITQLLFLVAGYLRYVRSVVRSLLFFVKATINSFTYSTPVAFNLF